MLETAESGSARRRLSFAELKELFTTELSEAEALGLVHAIPHVTDNPRAKYETMLFPDRAEDFRKAQFLMIIGNAATPTEPSERVRQEACRVLARYYLRVFTPGFGFYDVAEPQSLLDFYAAHEQHCPHRKEHEEVERFLKGCAEATFVQGTSRKQFFATGLVETAIFTTACAELIAQEGLYRFVLFFYNKERAKHQTTDKERRLFTDLEFDWTKIPHSLEIMHHNLNTIPKSELAKLEADFQKIFALCGRIMRDERIEKQGKLLRSSLLPLVLSLMAQLHWEIMQKEFYA